MFIKHAKRVLKKYSKLTSDSYWLVYLWPEWYLCDPEIWVYLQECWSPGFSFHPLWYPDKKNPQDYNHVCSTLETMNALSKINKFPSISLIQFFSLSNWIKLKTNYDNTIIILIKLFLQFSTNTKQYKWPHMQIYTIKHCNVQFVCELFYDKSKRDMSFQYFLITLIRNRKFCFLLVVCSFLEKLKNVWLSQLL